MGKKRGFEREQQHDIADYANRLKGAALPFSKSQRKSAWQGKRPGVRQHEGILTAWVALFRTGLCDVGGFENRPPGTAAD